MPVRVVQDDGCLVAWVASGTPVLRAVPVDGRPTRERSLAERFTVPKRFVVASAVGVGPQLPHRWSALAGEPARDLFPDITQEQPRWM
ncbi:MAG: hypothetical protein ABL986_19850 [Vicinamibacterales bacterium]